MTSNEVGFDFQRDPRCPLLRVEPQGAQMVVPTEEAHFALGQRQQAGGQLCTHTASVTRREHYCIRARGVVL